MTWATESRPWQSGRWTLELRGDEFADIAFAGRPVLRSVRAVIRDRNWDTARLVVDHVRESDATLMLHVRSEGLGSSFRGVVRVVARPSDLDVSADLESVDGFATNRSGLIVLHPPRLAGESQTVTHSTGATEATRCPSEISPHQPVRDIAGLSWAHGGLEVSLAFEGDVFEMEDQRNWSDASYKTYSRPLDLPFPYDIAAGERVRQTVRVRVRELAATLPPAAPDLIALEVGGPLPEIGLGAATSPDPAPDGPSGAAALLVELDLRTPNWRAALSRAERSGVPLDVRVIASPGAPFDELAGALAALGGSQVLRIGVFEADLHVTDAAVLGALRDALEDARLRVPIIAGSRAHFTELNREWAIIPRDVDGIGFSTTPLFHSTGTEQLVESVAVQRTIALQAVELADGLPVHVGPLALRARFNDVATTPQPMPSRNDLGDGYGAAFTGADDPRQSAPELAAWTIASAAALAVPGVASIAFFEEWGPRGLRSSAGEPFPVAAAFAALRELDGPNARLLWGSSPDGLAWAVGARSGSGDVVLVANLDDRAKDLTVVLDGASTAVALEPLAFIRLALPSRR